jgi:hemin uptake protein HemP
LHLRIIRIYDGPVPNPPRPQPAQPPAAPKPAAPGADTRRLSSAALFAGAGEVVIEHEGNEYRLRRTAQGKLILTK